MALIEAQGHGISTGLWLLLSDGGWDRKTIFVILLSHFSRAYGMSPLFENFDFLILSLSHSLSFSLLLSRVSHGTGWP